ncbi:MAG: cytochrome c [Caldimonas sp.]
MAAGAVWSTAPCLAADLALPPGPGRALVYGQCRTCHDLQYLTESAGVPRDTWSELLDSMKQYGLRISDDQRAEILDYLATYLGPSPPPAAAATSSADRAASVDGAAVFRDQCAACHLPNGQGVPGQFPPLANNADLFLSREFPARVVLFGLNGKIRVGEHTFDSVMPPLDVLSDSEIAAVVGYIRQAWDNHRLRPTPLKPLDAGEVTALRAGGGSAEQVNSARAELKKERPSPR